MERSSPFLDPDRDTRILPEWSGRIREIYFENIRLLMAIKRICLEEGKVDSRWDRTPPLSTQYFKDRFYRYRLIYNENKQIYERLQQVKPRVVPTSELLQQWKVHQREIIQAAQCKFVLFSVPPLEEIEDECFVVPEGVKRPRVYMTLRTRGAAILGTLTVELFTDVCPNTCRLFLDLFDGDGLGYGYVGTTFFRKVPRLFWSGGDVVYDNGYGCYAQRGRRQPIGAENYHFSHSIPGLLSMRVTDDNEMCGIFTITFKPMPQFDLKSVVFGRIVRPSTTYDAIQNIGSPLSPQPHIEVSATERTADGHRIHGSPNINIITYKRHAKLK